MMGMRTAHGPYLLRGQQHAINRPPRKWVLFRAKPFFAKCLFAAHKQRQVIAHVAAVAGDKARHATKMVAVGMAEDQPVHPPHVDAQKIDVAGDDLGREAEIKDVIGLLPRQPRLQMQRQAPFAGQR